MCVRAYRSSLTVRAVALEIGTAGSVSLISNIHWKSGHPVSLISNLGSPTFFLRRLRRRNRVAEHARGGVARARSQRGVVEVVDCRNAVEL